MTQATTDQINRLVNAVEQLSEQERELFDQRLAELDEARWQAEAAAARKAAEAAGITQEHIDRTIEKMRYG
jgi:hypothetical protein